MSKITNIINHIALVVDASDSMARHKNDVILVADEQIRHLAERSQELDQETRVSIWVFSSHSNIQCVIWDKDVLRLPSIAEFYTTSGQTALVDATLKSISDLDEIPRRYGDHSFLLYVLTDGQENCSLQSPVALSARLSSLPDYWTTAALVPDHAGVHEAKRFGFPAGNIAIWDKTSSTGVSEVGKRIRVATDTFMMNRKQGIRSTKTLFKTDAAAVNAKTISAAGLTPLPVTSYVLVPVSIPTATIAIKPFVESCGLTFRVGKGYYQLMKPEEIQANKQILIVEKKSGKVFGGQDARNLIGLPDMTVRVKPDVNPDYDVYVQSMSNNRNLIAHTKLLYLS